MTRNHLPRGLASFIFLLACPGLARPQAPTGPSTALVRFPAQGARDVSPDTHLVLEFSSAPTLGSSGQIRIYDAADDRLVDLLDLGIPPGPTARADAAALAAPYTPTPYEYVTGRFTNANTRPGTPSGASRGGLSGFQLTIIGGFTDAFHFYPVIVREKKGTIYPHNNLLEYDKKYYVQIDPTVLGGFEGFSGKTDWMFTTRKSPPPANSDRLVVSSDGGGDFNTVQGAIDFIPDHNPRRVTIFIRNGVYEEIVHFRNKANITFLGEDRDKTVVQYANNEVFNPHPPDVSTNEVPGTFPSRRAAFTGDNSSGIHIVNLTVKNLTKGQAEGLLLMGEKNIVSHVTIVGSGDALQVNGPAYFSDCRIAGDGDTILGRGPAFFERCDIESRGPFMWIRNTSANHGNVFLNSRFKAQGPDTVLARSPINRGKTYTHAEAVLINCSLSGVSPAGWGPVGGDPSQVRFWEYNSTDLTDGKPVDVSQRHPASRQLGSKEDATIIADYSNPSWVLGGWTPAMAPLILQPPVPVLSASGGITLSVGVAAIPEASYQWSRNGRAIPGATQATLEITNARKGSNDIYAVTAKNASGSATSEPVRLRGAAPR